MGRSASGLAVFCSPALRVPWPVATPSPPVPGLALGTSWERGAMVGGSWGSHGRSLHGCVGFSEAVRAPE